MAKNLEKNKALIHEQRIADVLDILALKPAIRHHALVEIMRQKWVDQNGKRISRETVNAIIKEAREEIIKHTQKSRAEWIAQLLHGYVADLASEYPQVRMMARKAIREMLGLDAHRQSNAETAQATIVQLIMPDNARGFIDGIQRQQLSIAQQDMIRKLSAPCVSENNRTRDTSEVANCHDTVSLKTDTDDTITSAVAQQTEQPIQSPTLTDLTPELPE